MGTPASQFGANPDHATSQGWKTIPLFISSTFRDMHAERDQLNRVVFPAIEERLKPRRCRIAPIDLRIGVETDSTQTERERELQILKVCLAEIERSRPFLLVLLGDRYGWVPGEDRIKTASSEAGFTPEENDSSVTALEIEYGLLKKDPAQRRRCLLCLREPLPYDRMPEEKAIIYSDAHATDPGALDRIARLKKLKAKINADPELVLHRKPYSLDWDAARVQPTAESVIAWGRAVEAELWKLLNEETKSFAAQAEPTWEEQERFAIEEQVERLNGSFVGRQPLVQRALELAGSATTQGAAMGLIFTGGSGTGKSALFARLHHELSQDQNVLLLAHAAGVSPKSGQTEWMLRRWIGELGAALGESPDVPENIKPEDLEKRLAQLLLRVTAKHRVVILVDALDQFLRTERARTVSWLPVAWPVNARFIATAIPGEESNKLARRPSFALVDVPPLDNSEAGAIAAQVYGCCHRKPNAEVLRAVLALRQFDGTTAADNPLWLTLALDLLNLLDTDDFTAAEAAVGGSPEEKLGRLVLDRARELPPNMEGLYGRLLAQVEKVAGMAETRAFAVLTALSRHGWREKDFEKLLPAASAILSDRLSAMPCHGLVGNSQFKWDPLRFAVLRRCFRTHLVRRGALEQWEFAHTTLRHAVISNFKISSNDRKAINGLVLDYFETLPSDDPLAYGEKMFHMIGHRNTRRAAGYLAQITQNNLVSNLKEMRKLVEPLASALAEPDSERAPETVLEWLISAIRNEDHDYTDHIIAFAVFCLDDLLESKQSSALDKVREQLLLVSQKTTSEEYEKKEALRVQANATNPAYSPEVRARLAEIDLGLARNHVKLKGALSTVIQRKIAAIYRKSNLDAAREANRKAYYYSEEFRVIDRERTLETSFAPTDSLFTQMIESLNQESIYPLPSLMALFRDGELLLAMGRHGDAIKTSTAVFKGVGNLWALFHPATEKLAAASRILTGDALLISGDAKEAVKCFHEARERLERGLDSIVDNENASDGFKVPNARSIQDVLEFLKTNLPKSKFPGWPSSLEWRHLIAIARRRTGNACLACGFNDEAAEEFRRSEDILSELLSQDPSNARYQFSMALLLLEKGRCLAIGGAWSDALSTVEESLPIFESHLERNEGNFSRQCIGTSLALGERILARLGNKSRADEFSKRMTEFSSIDGLPEHIDLSQELGDVWTKDDSEYVFIVIGIIRDDDLIDSKEIADKPINRDPAEGVEKMYINVHETSKGAKPYQNTPLQHAEPLNKIATETKKVDSGLRFILEGRGEEAVRYYQSLLFPGDCTRMNPSAPSEIRVNFVAALMMTQNVAGVETHLADLADSEDSRVPLMRQQFQKWHASLDWLQKLGLRKKPPLPVPAV